MCPSCNKPNSLSSRIFDEKKEQCQCDYRGKGVDVLLEVGGAFDWITPVYHLTKELYNGWIKKDDLF